jgi:hypothetical protein
MALLVSVTFKIQHILRRLLILVLLKGIISWNDPTTPDIKDFASRLALSMLKMTRFILNPSATFRQTTIQGVDVGLWEINPQRCSFLPPTQTTDTTHLCQYRLHILA